MTFNNLQNDKKPNHLFKLRTYDNYTLIVESFENGIAKLYIPYSARIIQVLDVVFGCFSTDSNIKENLRLFFESQDSLSCIQFIFNGITISVTPKDTKTDILKYYIDSFHFIPRHLNFQQL